MTLPLWTALSLGASGCAEAEATPRAPAEPETAGEVVAGQVAVVPPVIPRPPPPVLAEQAEYGYIGGAMPMVRPSSRIRRIHRILVR